MQEVELIQLNQELQKMLLTAFFSLSSEMEKAIKEAYELGVFEGSQSWREETTKKS
jgi:hypothetical protein